ncbi:unnamed protein product [Ceutorhynchus assimilis]|uniref:Clip domain-containing protein n=1 Tax=Ceutorhynchus assimilis TaxID=467358 RepID=A0A9N9QQY2_9CUCU|nr:unnamed protein product [Ceutorhynchus assimilis]
MFLRVVFGISFLFVLTVGQIEETEEKVLICRTPNGEAGECVSIYKCDAFLKLINGEPKKLTAEVKQFLRASEFQERPCLTPNQTKGYCVLSQNCPHIEQKLQIGAVTPPDKQFITLSICGYDANKKILFCCDINEVKIPEAERSAPAPNVKKNVVQTETKNTEKPLLSESNFSV